MNEQEAFRKERFSENKPLDNKSTVEEKSTLVNEVLKEEEIKKPEVVTEVKKTVKSQTKAI